MFQLSKQECLQLNENTTKIQKIALWFYKDLVFYYVYHNGTFLIILKEQETRKECLCGCLPEGTVNTSNALSNNVPTENQMKENH